LPELREEFGARRLAGLDVEWVDGRSLGSEWGLLGAGAIRSAVGAQMDPHALCTALLARSEARGARVHDGTPVETIREHGDTRELRTGAGHSVMARHVVHAGGYEAAALLPPGLVDLHCTFAIASGPLREARPGRCTMWELASPYLYARWAGDRLLVGGEDEPFTGTAAQDEQIPRKADRLARRISALVPGLSIEPTHAWAGPFATTPDGLGYIGRGPRDPSVLFALGFGGNGVTFAAAAAEMLADVIAGRPNPDVRLFAFGRESIR
jgi:glycine/D-amino acid oxidase-like deaminating enzyme